MNFVETFLKLTEYTTPFKSESDLENILNELIPDLKKDQIGNYHKVIGNSETLFTAHLDNYCKKKEKVNHVISEGNVISTDGKTILGADNKAGVCVLLYLISNNVPGHYCFFIGEEPILSGGCYGSFLFNKYYKDIKKYKRAISFDRKAEGSIITRQMAQRCCSNTFADALIREFETYGLQMKKDAKGYYTDSASFLSSIEEVTNISVGVYKEHTVEEYVDLNYTEKIAKAASLINWENLPVQRKAIDWYDRNKSIVASNNADLLNLSKTDDSVFASDEELFNLLSSYLSKLGYCFMSPKFDNTKVLLFNKWFEEKPIEVLVYKGSVYIFRESISYNLARKDPMDMEDIKYYIDYKIERGYSKNYVND